MAFETDTSGEEDEHSCDEKARETESVQRLKDR